MRNTPAGMHELKTHLLTTLRYWTLGFDGKRSHMECYLVLSEYMRLIFFWNTFICVIHLDFAKNMLKNSNIIWRCAIQLLISRPTTQDLQ